MLRSGLTAVACVDEAGRGALCGPVSVGVVVVRADTKPAPLGVRDSKLLSAEQRLDLLPKIMRWAVHAVGMASADEIDRLGIVPAMRLAGHRALAALPLVPDQVLLDGSHDYLSEPAQTSIFGADAEGYAIPAVVTKVKADLHCAGVAAASILAKTARDALMIEWSADYPEYGWAGNKGYGAPDHLEALTRLGPTRHHRVSWSLPGPA
ncbi:MAG: ribonuclease HII [Actinobacteria bacterium]|uniref:Ribonuclease HII n=1 Tax=freshwater metagenome TaxID=449393 RepID=A0A6J7EP40_9ZZZZ|nr:ribonuclease HII [Actinomycetota bacterium]